MQNSFSRVPSSKICVLVPDAQILGAAARMLVSILSTISNLTQLISCQYILREVVVRQGGSVASLLSLPHLSHSPCLVSSSAPPLSLPPPFEVRRALLLLACYYQGLTTIPLKLLPCRKKGAEIVSPPSGTNSSLPSKALIAAPYQDDLQHPNRAEKSQSSPFCQTLWGVNHLIMSVKLPSEGSSL